MHTHTARFVQEDFLGLRGERMRSLKRGKTPVRHHVTVEGNSLTAAAEKQKLQ